MALQGETVNVVVKLQATGELPRKEDGGNGTDGGDGQDGGNGGNGGNITVLSYKDDVTTKLEGGPGGNLGQGGSPGKKGYGGMEEVVVG